MLCELVVIYVFISATGAWSTHSGMGAFCFLIFFVMALTWGGVLAFMAPSLLSHLIGLSVRSIAGKEAGKNALNIADAVDLVVNGVAFIVPTIFVAIGAFLLYMIGLEDWLSSMFPTFFPQGGYLFTDAKAGVFDFVCWAYLGWLNYSLINRFK